MSIRVQCGCGCVYNVEDGDAGRRAKCSQCGATLSIPHPPAAPVKASPPTVSVDAAGALEMLASEVKPSAKPRRSPARPRRGAVMAALLLGVLALPPVTMFQLDRMGMHVRPWARLYVSRSAIPPEPAGSASVSPEGVTITTEPKPGRSTNAYSEPKATDEYLPPGTWYLFGLPGAGWACGALGAGIALWAILKRRPMRVLAIVALCLGAVAGAGNASLVGWRLHVRSAQRSAQMCGANLSEIGKAVYLYRAQHSGGFPPTLEALVEANLVDPVRLRCPAHAGGYFYHAPANDETLMMMGCELTAAHQALFYEEAARPVGVAPGTGMRMVLASDGSVVLFSDAAFQSALAALENADFAKAYRQATKQ